jgi:hypothetical protein
MKPPNPVFVRLYGFLAVLFLCLILAQGAAQAQESGGTAGGRVHRGNA